MSQVASEEEGDHDHDSVAEIKDLTSIKSLKRKRPDHDTDNSGSSTNNDQYEPAHFIRSHCPDIKSPGVTVDGQTQIWDVAFAPDSDVTVATSGGRYLCVFNVETGELKSKYCHKNKNEDLFSVAWTKIEDCGNLIATGSSSGEIRLYHLERNVSIHHWTETKNLSVNAVQFHSQYPNYLFSASKEGAVKLWTIGDPAPPYYERANNQLLLTLEIPGVDLYSMAWVPEGNWLMAGSLKGLVGWSVSVPEALQQEKINICYFRLPEGNPPSIEHKWPYVDSVCYLGDGLVATKCVAHGKILIFRPPEDTSDKVRWLSNRNEELVTDVEVLVELPWCQTDNFYMNIGGLSSLGLVACGDDEGNIYMYQLPDWLTEDVNNNQELGRPARVAPLGILPWPHLEGVESSSGDIMMDKVVISPSGNHLVAVTNNNIVAIWKKVIQA